MSVHYRFYWDICQVSAYLQYLPIFLRLTLGRIGVYGDYSSDPYLTVKKVSAAITAEVFCSNVLIFLAIIQEWQWLEYKCIFKFNHFKGSEMVWCCQSLSSRTLVYCFCVWAAMGSFLIFFYWDEIWSLVWCYNAKFWQFNFKQQ